MVSVAVSDDDVNWKVFPPMIKERVYARVGFLGNPSDIYCGRSIAFSLKNFHAEVVLEPATTISFVPHSTYDKNEYASLAGFVSKVQGEGYYGGIRLLMAVCKRFHDYCKEQNITLEQKNFRMSYDTNIPRQTGLSGSSAIVCAALKCLLAFYGVGKLITFDRLPAFALRCEEDLGITAGPQDRVIQMYGGLVFMDFKQSLMEERGYGEYEVLDPSLLPPLWIMFSDNPSESGKVHSPVRKRWLDGDPEIRAAITEVAGLAVQGREALQQRDHARLAALMNRNADLRRQMFGDAALGAANVRMVELARSVGAAVNFTGSGGAVSVFCPEGAEQAKQLQAKCSAEGFTLVPAEVGPSNTSLQPAHS